MAEMECTVEIKLLNTISNCKLEILAHMSWQEWRAVEHNVNLGFPNHEFLTFGTGWFFFWGLPCVSFRTLGAPVAQSVSTRYLYRTLSRISSHFVF